MAAGSVSSEIQLQVRWAAFITGFTPNEDYRPTISSGESAALADEVQTLFTAFHPHNEIRLFPTKDPVLLFAKSRSTGDYLLAQVRPAEENKGVRRAIEYYALILNADTLSQLNNNPFRAEEMGLFGYVRDQFRSGKRSPLVLGMSGHDLRPRPRTDRGGAAASGQVTRTGEMTPYTVENLRALEDYVARVAEGGKVPPTFATWWESGKPTPEGYFQIVLRSKGSQALRLSDIEDLVKELIQDIRGYLPNAPTNDVQAQAMIGSIIKEAKGLEEALLSTVHGVSSISVDEFRSRMSAGATQAQQISSEISSLRLRMERYLTVGDVAHLQDLSDRCVRLSEELPKLRHPNPFAAKNTPAAAAAIPSTGGSGNGAKGSAAARSPIGPGGSAPGASAAPGASKRLPVPAIAGGVALLAIGGLAFGIMSGRKNAETPGGDSARPVPNSATTGPIPGTPPVEEDHAEEPEEDTVDPNTLKDEQVKKLMADLKVRAPQLIGRATQQGEDMGYRKTRLVGRNAARTNKAVTAWAQLTLNDVFSSAGVLPSGVRLKYVTYELILENQAKQVRDAVDRGRLRKVAEIQARPTVPVNTVQDPPPSGREVAVTSPPKKRKPNPAPQKAKASTQAAPEKVKPKSEVPKNDPPKPPEPRALPNNTGAAEPD